MKMVNILLLQKKWTVKENPPRFQVIAEYVVNENRVSTRRERHGNLFLILFHFRIARLTGTRGPYVYYPSPTYIYYFYCACVCFFLRIDNRNNNSRNYRITVENDCLAFFFLFLSLSLSNTNKSHRDYVMNNNNGCLDRTRKPVFARTKEEGATSGPARSVSFCYAKGRLAWGRRTRCVVVLDGNQAFKLSSSSPDPPNPLEIKHL